MLCRRSTSRRDLGRERRFSSVFTLEDRSLSSPTVNISVIRSSRMINSSLLTTELGEQVLLKLWAQLLFSVFQNVVNFVVGRHCVEKFFLYFWASEIQDYCLLKCDWLGLKLFLRTVCRLWLDESPKA